jgi:hypothetical protein
MGAAEKIDQGRGFCGAQMLGKLRDLGESEKFVEEEDSCEHTGASQR